MQQIKEIIQEMIPIKATELNGFIKQCSLKTYKKSPIYLTIKTSHNTPFLSIKDWFGFVF